MAAQGETKRQKAAFDYYYKLGDDRSLNKVAKFFGVSNSSVRSWSDKYEWDLRIAQTNAEQADELINKSDTAMVCEMESNRKVIRTSLQKFMENLKAGKVEINRVKDAVDLMRLDREYVEFIVKLKENQNAKETALQISQDTQATIRSLMSDLKSLSIEDDRAIDKEDNTKEGEDGVQSETANNN